MRELFCVRKSFLQEDHLFDSSKESDNGDWLETLLELVKLVFRLALLLPFFLTIYFDNLILFDLSLFLGERTSCLLSLSETLNILSLEI